MTRARQVVETIAPPSATSSPVQYVSSTDDDAIQQMLATTADTHAVIFATTTHPDGVDHYFDHRLTSLHAGKHVYLQHPIAHTLKDIHTSYDAAEQAPACQLFVSSPYRHDSTLAHLRDTLTTRHRREDVVRVHDTRYDT